MLEHSAPLQSLTYCVFLGAFANWRKANIRFVVSIWLDFSDSLSVRMEQFDARGRIFIKFQCGIFFQNFTRKFNFH
jgi:hypothetical protein